MHAGFQLEYHVNVHVRLKYITEPQIFTMHNAVGMELYLRQKEKE